MFGASIQPVKLPVEDMQDAGQQPTHAVNDSSMQSDARNIIAFDEADLTDSAMVQDCDASEELEMISTA